MMLVTSSIFFHVLLFPSLCVSLSSTCIACWLTIVLIPGLYFAFSLTLIYTWFHQKSARSSWVTLFVFYFWHLDLLKLYVHLTSNSTILSYSLQFLRKQHWRWRIRGNNRPAHERNRVSILLWTERKLPAFLPSVHHSWDPYQVTFTVQHFPLTLCILSSHLFQSLIIYFIRNSTLYYNFNL